MEGVLRPVAALHLSVCKIDGQPLLTSVVSTGLKAALPLRETWSSSFLFLTEKIYAIQVSPSTFLLVLFLSKATTTRWKRQDG